MEDKRRDHDPQQLIGLSRAGYRALRDRRPQDAEKHFGEILRLDPATGKTGSPSPFLRQS